MHISSSNSIVYVDCQDNSCLSIFAHIDSYFWLLANHRESPENPREFLTHPYTRRTPDNSAAINRPRSSIGYKTQFALIGAAGLGRGLTEVTRDESERYMGK